MDKIQLVAQLRQEHGRSASRRLRHSGNVPGIIYGSNAEAISISLNHNTIYHALKREAFHTSILSLDLDGKKEQVLLRDHQVHPFRQQVLHLDFQRVNEKEEVQMRIPLHFINEDTCYAVKTQAAHITHVINDVEIRAFAKDIPHFIEVDIKDIKAGQTVHLSNLALPSGVALVNLLRGDDSAVVIAAGIAEEEISNEAPVVAAADIPTVSGKKDVEA
ncbi:MAG: 50S ribosomal protein L25/general stress protein Ctc [Proteobacteria bacterium]|jgi:large subunit ribosomal protein L25|nr:50S ribosomal protein L25/general stress protein Ctc [Pseudomonadota bacterium]